MAMANAGFSPATGHRSGGSDPGPGPGNSSAGGRVSPHGSGRRASPTGTVDSGTMGSELGVLGLPDVLRQRAMAELGDLERGALIGRGSFGRVYKGRWRGATPCCSLSAARRPAVAVKLPCTWAPRCEVSCYQMIELAR